MASHFFGPLGAMERLIVSTGVTAETARAQSEFVSSGGVRYVQQGRAAPRTWTVGRQYRGPDWARVLSLAAHGLLGQCWLYDVTAARENMIPAQLSAGTGAPVQVTGLPMDSLPTGHVVQVPVLAGVLYTASVWADLVAGSEVLTYRVGDADPVPVVMPVGGGARQGVGSFTPPADSILTLTVTVAGCSGLRVHQGSPDGAFHAGHGTPCKVVVQDPARTLQLVTNDIRSDYQVTLLEVGRPGTL